MKIANKAAILLHGIVGGIADRNGIGEQIDVLPCYRLLLKNVLSKYDCDIFIHSWSKESEKYIVDLYNPKLFLFEQQDMFGYKNSQEELSRPEFGQGFRTTSKYASLEKSNNLKLQYEKENGFTYKWVMILRFDLLFFSAVNFDDFDTKYFYCCDEPHWTNIHDLRIIDDRIFLANSSMINKYTTIAKDIRNGKCNPSDAHAISYRKIMDIVNGDTSLIRYGFRRYSDVEIYRMVVNPNLNPIGHQYGAIEASAKFKKMEEEWLMTEEES